MKLEILMDFQLRSEPGRAGVRWTFLSEHPALSETQLRIATAAMNYARTLFVTNSENRAKLFHVVQAAAQGLANGKPALELPHWPYDVRDLRLWVWPWTLDQPERLNGAKTYVARLHVSEAGTFRVKLKVAWGYDKILAPSAALIPLFALSKELTAADRVRLGTTLVSVNRYYESPEAANVIEADTKAFQHALPNLLENPDGPRVTCPHCGHPCDSAANFCAGCGVSLRADRAINLNSAPLNPAHSPTTKVRSAAAHVMPANSFEPVPLRESSASPCRTAATANDPPTQHKPLSKRCPKCNLPSRADAKSCVCGYGFLTGVSHASTLFESTNQLASVVVALLCANVALGIVAVMSSLLEVELLNRIANSVDVGEVAIASSDTRQAVIGGIQAVLLIVTVVAFCRWLHRSYRNLTALGWKSLKYSPGQAVASFFIPFVCLVRPLRVMTEVWNLSNPQHTTASVDQPFHRPGLLNRWWSLYLGGSFVGNRSTSLWFQADETSELLNAAWWGIAGDLAWVAAGVPAILIVKSITDMQAARHSVPQARHPQAVVNPQAGASTAG